MRRWALAGFGLSVSLGIAYVVASRGLAGHPGFRPDVDWQLGDLLGSVIPPAIGLVLVWARPRNPIGWLVMATGLAFGACNAGQAYGARALVVPEEHLPLGALAMSLSAPLWIPALFIPASLLLVRYPTGTMAGTWPRSFDRLVTWGFLPLYVGYATSPNSVTDSVPDGLPPLVLPEAVGGSLMLVGLLAVATGTLLIVGDAVRRALRAGPAERSALLLVAVAATLAVVLVFSQYEWLGSVAYFGILVAIAIGVLRYQALGIEVVVRRALVYGVLTGLVLLVFVGVVTLLTRVVPDSLAPQVLAAALIAIGLAPARDRVQRGVDRLLYGERNDPVAALRRLSSPIQTASGRILPAVLASLGQALRLRGVEFRDGDDVERWGEVDGEVVSVRLGYGGHDLGELRASTRSGQRSLGRADRAMLQAIAPLVAAIRQATRVTDQLRVEQSRVVKATQSERTRLRQELHDGLGPSLTGIGLSLEAVEQRTQDPTTRAIVARLRDEVAAALEETRRLIDGLRPAALDDSDLVGALRRRVEQASGDALRVALELPEPLPALPPAVEAAAFRIAEEALTNVVRHSRARSATIELTADTWLHLRVVDDGVGVSVPRPGGVGLESMRARAEQVGGRLLIDSRPGGTTVLADLPLEAA